MESLLPRGRARRTLLFLLAASSAAHAQSAESGAHWRGLAGLVDPQAYVMPPYRISDPLYAYDTRSPNRHQWALNAVNLPAALAWSRGRALIGAGDGGIQGNIDIWGEVSPLRPLHPDLEPNLRRHLSYDTQAGSGGFSCEAPWPIGVYNGSLPPLGHSVMHGTHVAGIMAAVGDNGIGVSGACPHCSFVMMAARPSSEGCMGKALTFATRNGVGVMNFSWGVPSGVDGESYISRASLDAAADYDVFVVAITGNFLRPQIDYPASYPKVTAVAAAAVDWNDPAHRVRLWDERNGLDHVGVLQPPGVRCDLDATPPKNNQCGSNSGPGTSLVAPGAQILSTVTAGFGLGTPAQPATAPPCGSETDPSGSGGYGVCSGTSMAGPLVAGIAGLVRSVSPLLSWEETRRALTETARSDAAVFIGYSPQSMGAGLPDAEAAVRRALGVVGGATVFNRLTPLFSLLACRPACSDVPAPLGTDVWLFTTNPQLAAVAQNGEMHFTANGAQASPVGLMRPTRYLAAREAAGVGPKIARGQYHFRHPALNPPVPAGADPDEVSPRHAGASAYLFTTPRDPVSGAEIDPATGHSYLVPLLRLGARCDSVRKAVYAVTQGEPGTPPGSREFFESRGEPFAYCDTAPATTAYDFDAVEGYLWRAWLPGATQPLPQPPGTRKLLRYYNPATASWALLLDDEASLPAFAGYAPADETRYGRNLLGYVYPNTDADADGLIDGFERIIGTNPERNDSDCDGLDDGVEFPLARLAVSDPLDGRCLPPEGGPRSRQPFLTGWPPPPR